MTRARIPRARIGIAVVALVSMLVAGTARANAPMKSALARRNAGFVVSLIGMALSVSGIVYGAVNYASLTGGLCDTGPCRDDITKTRAVTGVLLGTGLAALAVGLPLWITGDARVSWLRKHQPTAGVILVPRAGGAATLSVRF